jgi:hypothetical protein
MLTLIDRICPEGVDLVLDCLCGEHTNKGISITKPLGKYILYGTSKNLDGESKNYFAIAKNWWNVDKVSPLKLYEENRSLSGFNLHNFIFNNMSSSRRHILDIYSKLFALYRDGLIKPIIDSVHSFDDVSTALAKLHERQNIGKVLLEPYLDEANVNISVSSIEQQNCLVIIHFLLFITEIRLKERDIQVIPTDPTKMEQTLKNCDNILRDYFTFLKLMEYKN